MVSTEKWHPCVFDWNLKVFLSKQENRRPELNFVNGSGGLCSSFSQTADHSLSNIIYYHKRQLMVSTYLVWEYMGVAYSQSRAECVNGTLVNAGINQLCTVLLLMTPIGKMFLLLLKIGPLFFSPATCAKSGGQISSCLEIGFRISPFCKA